MKMVDPAARRALLCIEKDEAARAVLRDALCDYEIEFTIDAFETIRSMHARAFDGYIVDFWLPDWSGPQLCRAIRDVDPHCPIIFCSAAEADLSKQRALRAGASAYFSKPVDTDALRETLTSHMARVDIASLRAKAEMEQVVQAELVRWAPRLAGSSPDNELVAQSLNRTARARAYRTFLAAGGSRAHFDRWWPHVFGSARANNGVAAVATG